ncbi:MAG TPA: hypothetical protein VD905_01235 [Flavobacteriales bacterium]|nr:hypothetical protein [Flavobacteriales bacterium]
MQAQRNAYIDSVWRVYNNKHNHDTIRIAALDELAWSYVNINPDTTIHQCRIKNVVVYYKTIYSGKLLFALYDNYYAQNNPETIHHYSNVAMQKLLFLDNG